MRIEEVLEQRHTLKLRWVEPWSACGPELGCNHVFVGHDMLCKKCGIYFPERENEPTKEN